MPDNVRALRGTHPERAEAKSSKKPVKFPPAAPEPPADLDTEAVAEWKRVVPELDSKGLLAKVDRGVIASYCRAWSHACAAETWLRDGLVFVDDDGNERKSPMWQVWREATVLMTALAKELLLTPNARLRATMPDSPDDPDSGGILD